VKLTTPRLTLRAPEEADATLLRDYFVRNAERFAPWEPRRSERVDDHRVWIAAHRGHSSTSDPIAFLAFEKDGNQLVAAIELDSFSRDRPLAASINYTVDATYEGRGFASEAVRAVAAHAFDVLKLDILSAYYHPNNLRSERLLGRAGFTTVARTDVIPGFERLMRPTVLAQRRAR
jgi:ribosomal-protein-alanine N-acetyltransferase